MLAFCNSQTLQQVANLAIHDTPFVPHISKVNNLLLATAVFSGLLLCLSIAAVVIRVMVGGNLFTKVNGYLTPNTPLLGSIMLVVYSLMAVAGSLVSREHLYKGGALERLVHLLVLLPAPLFLWAWLYAAGAVYSYHTTAHGAEEHPGCHSAGVLGPRLLNTIFATVPILSVIMGVVCISVTLSVYISRMVSTSVEPTLALRAGSQNVDWSAAIHNCDLSDRFYRSVWAFWAFLFVFTVSIYLVYFFLLQNHLRREISFLDLGTPVVNDVAVIPNRVQSHQESAKRRAVDTALRVLRRNMVLSRFETVFFASYCTAWAIIGCYKAAEGLRLLAAVRYWGNILCIELMLAAACASLTQGVVIWRGLSIYRTQRRMKRRAARTLTSGTSVQITIQTDFQVETFELVDEVKSDGLDSPDIPDIGDSVAPLVSPIRIRFPSISEMSAGGEETKGEEFLPNPPGPWEAPAAWGLPPPTSATHFPPTRGLRRTVSFEVNPLRPIEGLIGARRERVRKSSIGGGV